MANFAKLNSKNIVEQVVVIDNAVLDDGTGVENEQQGIDYCIELWGDGTYVQTSYNNNFRKDYAHIGGTFDSSDNGFIKPQPFPSWTFDKDKWEWIPPIPDPDDADTVMYLWNERNLSWDKAKDTSD